MKELLFKDRGARYSDFSDAVQTKDGIKTLIEAVPGLQAKHAAFDKALDHWWKKNVPEIERLPETRNVFELRRHCIDNLAKALTPQGILRSKDFYRADRNLEINRVTTSRAPFY